MPGLYGGAWRNDELSFLWNVSVVWNVSLLWNPAAEVFHRTDNSPAGAPLYDGRAGDDYLDYGGGMRGGVKRFDNWAAWFLWGCAAPRVFFLKAGGKA
jgi:hypothetical protein